MRRSSYLLISLIALLSLLPVITKADIQFSVTPVWQKDQANFPTGAAWADLDGNGWIDLVLANGIDYIGRPNQVFFNSEGGLADNPGWVSKDWSPSCQIALGDLNDDGLQDMVVATLGHYKDFSPESQVIYFGTPGGFSPLPGWYSAPAMGF